MKRPSPWRYLWTAPDIRRKLLITVLLLVIYRFVTHIPVPGVDRDVMEAIFASGGAGANLLNIINLISGGTVRNFSILAMGVYPYITAQIIVQLLVPIIPAWQRRMEDDPREGRKWMERTTYILTIPMAALNAFGQINIFSSLGGAQVIPNFSLVNNFLPSFTVLAVMTGGTMFAIWLGELISEYGIRNQGLSLIIFAGIISQMPSSYAQVLANEATRWPALISLVIITVLTIFVIVFVQQGRRNVPVLYPGRRVGNRMSMPVKGTLPLMVNMAGMIPLIFGQAILSFPAIIASFFVASETEWVANFAAGTQALFGGTGNGYWIIYFFMVVLFAFFYTDVLFAQQNYGENLKRAGAQIPGVKPGKQTQEYLTRVLRRITLPGAVFLGVVAILPWLASQLIPALGTATSGGGGNFLINASGLLIVVGVVRDTFFNIDAELKLHGYEESLLVR
ncbi:MAG: preprotein translocase subunit SecY [Anaerolineae bacterium]|nr:MAG: preprotein translocase subunit SecY [Anaerolineae bacterium]